MRLHLKAFTKTSAKQIFTDLEAFKAAAKAMGCEVMENATTGLSTASTADDELVGMFNNKTNKGILFASNAEFEAWDIKTHGRIR
jgi:hypothetical protein